MAINNANLLQMCRDCGAAGFVPVVSYAYDGAGAEVTVTNSSTIPAGDTFAKVHVRVHDFSGKAISGAITVPATPLVLDISTLNRSKPLAITVTVITTNNIVADGSAHGIIDAGTVGFYDIQKNATA